MNAFAFEQRHFFCYNARMNERKAELLLSGISLGILAQAIFGVISRETRDAVYNRVWKKFGKMASEKSRKDDEPLEIAHINHDPRYPKYDDPSNMRMLTISEHLADHKNRAGRNGLDPEQNEWAIAEISKRLALFKSGARD